MIAGQLEIQLFANVAKLMTDMESLNRGVTRHMQGVEKAASLARQALGALGVGVSVNQVVQYADSWKLVNNQLRQVTENEAQLRAVRGQVLGIARSTNAELGNTVNLYSELYRATRDLNTSQGEVVTVTKTINNLFKAGGKDASETAGALRQLAQGLAAGALRGDEFNSVAEGAPRILDAIAQYLGKARGELRDFAAEGGITADVMVNALAAYEEEAQRLADLTEDTFKQKLTNAGTNVAQFAGESRVLSGAVDLLGDSIEVLSENLDLAASAGVLVASIYGARLVPVIAKHSQQLIVDAAHTQALTMAREMSAAADVKKAQSTYSLIAAEVENTRTVLASIAAEKQLEAIRLRAQITDKGRQLSVARMADLRAAEVAINRQLTAQEAALAGAHAATTAAENAHAAATTRLTVAQRGLAAASTAASGALALVGGTVGAIALVAGGVFYKLVQDQKESADAAWAQATAFDAVLARLGEMQEKELVTTALSLNGDIEKTRAQIQALEQQIEQMKLDPLSDKYIEFAGKVSSLNVQLEAQQSNQALVIDQLHRLTGVAGDAADSVVKWTDAERDSITELAVKRAELAMSGREAAIFKAVWEQYAKGAGPEAIARIAEQAGALYDQEQQIKAATDAATEQQKAEDKVREAREKATRTIAEQISGMEVELQLIQMTNRQRAIAEALLKATSAAREANRALTGEETAAIVANAAALYDQQAAIEAKTQAQKDADEKAKKMAADAAAAQKKHIESVAEAHRDAARKADQEWMHFRDSFSDYVRDVGMRNNDVVETIEDAWKGLGWKIMGDLAASGFLSLLGGKGGGGLGFGGAGGTNGSVNSLFANAGAGGALLSKLGLGDYIGKVATGGKYTLTNAEMNYLQGGQASPGGLNVTDLKNIGLSIGAGIAGSWAGTEFGESIFGKQAESSWGATAGGALGAMYGPLGAFIGSALGGMVDAAFGGDGLKRQNAGFLASPTPGLKDEYNAGEHTFASGLKVTLFARRTDSAAARAILDVFDPIDKSYVDLVNELGGKVSVSAMRGLDEEANPGSYGNFFGTGGNGTSQGDITAQVLSYIQQLADGTTGLDQALIDAVKSAGSAEEALTLLTEAVAKKTEADKSSAKALSEQLRLQDEYDQLTMTSAQLLQKQRDALEESNRALFDMVVAAREAKAAAERLAEAERSAAQARIESAEVALGLAMDGVSDAMSAVTRAVQHERDQITKAYNESARSIQEGLDKVRALSSALQSSLGTIGFGPARADAQAQLRMALAMARASGVLPDAAELQPALKALSEPSEGLFSSFLDYQRDFIRTSNEISELADIADGQIAAQQTELDVLKAGFDGEMARLDRALAYAQAELDALNGIDSSLMTLSQAMMLLASKITGASGALGVRDAVKDAANAGYVPYSADEIRQYVAANNLSTVQDLYAAAVEKNADPFAVGAALGYTAAETLAKLQAAQIPGFATGGDHLGGLRWVGEVGPELEYTGPSHITSNNDVRDMLRGDDIVAELKALRGDMSDIKGELQEVRRSSKDTADRLEQWETLGMPLREEEEA